MNRILITVIAVLLGVLMSNLSFADNNAELSVPCGKIIQGTFDQSKIYPGTTRSYSVYVPSQYDPAKPACVYVQQDGLGQIEAGVFDKLIARKEMPITIGVFVSWAKVPAPKDKDTDFRFHRNVEYDALGDDYVRFINDELLPYIAKKDNLKMSASGNDRCIGGASSGGICAFNAAWERPDLFSRVYSNSGSFVGFRGGNEFPILIRKYEAKPIRVYLTTGTNDMENCAGDWTLLNLEMDKSLRFSGYDYVFHKLEGEHCAGWGSPDQFSDVMRFLWKGWPETVKAGASAPRAQDIIIPGEKWQLVAKGYKQIEGCACNSKGNVFFVDVPNNRICRIGIDGKADVFINDAGHANSLTFGSKDQLYTVSSVTGKVMVYDTAGKGYVLAQGIYGRHITAKPDGGVYITAPGASGKSSNIWFVKQGHKAIVDSNMKLATGLAISPDQWLLFVADERSKHIYSYQINSDGTLSNKAPFYWLHIPDCEESTGTEAICRDKEGHIYAATFMGVQVGVAFGATQVILPVPSGRVTGICFGGSDLDVMFAFCGDKIFKRKVKTHGIGAFSPFSRMPGGLL